MSDTKPTSGISRLRPVPLNINADLKRAEDALLGPTYGGVTREAALEQGTALEALAARSLPQERKVPCNTRIPESLDRLVNNKIMELKAGGATKITKEAVLTDALRLYFGIL